MDMQLSLEPVQGNWRLPSLLKILLTLSLLSLKCATYSSIYSSRDHNLGNILPLQESHLTSFHHDSSFLLSPGSRACTQEPFWCYHPFTKRIWTRTSECVLYFIRAIITALPETFNSFQGSWQSRLLAEMNTS